MTSIVPEQSPIDVSTTRPLTEDDCRGDAREVARELLGSWIVSEIGGEPTGGTIIETEAYLSEGDDANHAVRSGKTDRNQSMFGPPGQAYVYTIYGMYECLNLVCGEPGAPEAVLLRALEPGIGIDNMRERREQNRSTPVADHNIAGGPGMLTMALGINREHDGMSLTGEGPVTLYRGMTPDEDEITRGPRVGIDYAEQSRDWPLRFRLLDENDEDDTDQ